MAQAVLDGHAWGRSRGAWQSCVRLEGIGRQWFLRDGDLILGEWPSLRAAFEELWPRRTVCGGDPWAIGWLGFAACAELGGDLPVLPGREGELEGVLLLEPEAVEVDQVLDDGGPGSGAQTVSNPDSSGFEDRVEKIRSEIAAGRVYQANLCRRFSVSPWNGGLQPLFDAAQGRRDEDYLCAMKWGGERAGELVCASMELLLRRRGNRMETRPIKGTRPRGSNPGEDQALIHQLEEDAKERAELAMIVDLERNDLGRVACTGSVVVEDPGSVGTWTVVHHRVARVAAEPVKGLAWWDLLAAVLPGGSITGCPKRAAMELIAKLEVLPRGPFTGALGVVSGQGDLEIALPIRTAWIGRGSLEMAAGCGVVWESRPENEEKESRLKISRWLNLVAGTQG